MSAMLMRTDQSIGEGHASNSRVLPPPFFQGCGGTSAASITLSVRP
jgi:hypothetical protein